MLDGKMQMLGNHIYKEDKGTAKGAKQKYCSG